MSETSSTNKEVIIARQTGSFTADAIEDAIFADEAQDIVYQSVISSDVIPKVKQIEIARLGQSFSGHKHAMMDDYGEVTLTMPLEGPIMGGSGSAGGEEPYYGPVLRAANLEPTITSATSSYWSPSTVAQDAMTVYEYRFHLEDSQATLYRSTGVRGTIGFNFTVGQEATLSFTGRGSYKARVPGSSFFNSDGEVVLTYDGSAVTARTTGEYKKPYNDKAPMICQGMTIACSGSTWDISALQLDGNYTTTPLEALNATDGAVSDNFNTKADTGARWGGSLSCFGETAYDEMLSNWEAGTEFTISGSISNADGEKITFYMPKVQLGEPAYADNGGVQTYDVPFFCNGDYTGSLAGDNELIIGYGLTSTV